MRPLVLDKIASVTMNCNLSREVRVGDRYPCLEGDVLAVRILNRKSTYNQLELPSGRFSALNLGDVIAGALGHRHALNGYAGHIPRTLQTGDTLQLLNIGGVLGICDSVHPDLGAPFECEVLGQVQHFPYLGERIGVPANISQGAKALGNVLESAGIPVVIVVGSCMNSGKTAACHAIIQELSRRRLKVAAAKSTGVSLRRDVLAMEDAGARSIACFTDLGVVTTQQENAASITRTLLTLLAQESPDVIVVELGDGLLGRYGVDSILEDPELRKSFSAILYAASDPVSVWGGLQLMRERYQLEATVVTGPATDNIAGTATIEALGVPARNARVHPRELTELLMTACHLQDGGQS